MNVERSLTPRDTSSAASAAVASRMPKEQWRLGTDRPSRLLLSDKRSMTVPVALAQFLNSDESPWNYMMATAIIYAIPPVVIYYMFRGRMTSGLTMGGVKG